MKQIMQNMKSKIALAAGVAFAALASQAHATALIANDTLEGLPQLGTNVGDMLGNMAPGLFKFILLLGIGGGVVALIVAIIFVVKQKAGRVVR